MNDAIPFWLSVHTRKVLHPFIGTLARSHKWRVIYLISPWISSFGLDAGMSFDQLLKRMVDDDVTAYIVTRTPIDNWHQIAIDALAKTNKATIKFADHLHTKLYGAKTVQGDFALFGSANLTQKSLNNRELGIFVRGTIDGGPLVRQLTQEAAEIFRTPGCKIYCQRKFGSK